jgi:hypothetical protein
VRMPITDTLPIRERLRLGMKMIFFYREM